jgi:hypothetical protein
MNGQMIRSRETDGRTVWFINEKGEFYAVDNVDIFF